MTRLLTKILSLLALLAGAAPAAAQGELVVYCTVQEEWCRPMVAAFEKATGIKVLMTRKSSGEFYAQLKAEAANPKGDIWWGGTGDPHLQAAEEGLTDSYVSPRLARTAGLGEEPGQGGSSSAPSASTPARSASATTRSNWPSASCPNPSAGPIWSSRIYKDDVQVANPNSSGTSYTMLATLVQIMGEQKAFDYLKALHKNINQYTKSGAAPARAAATGESLIGITFQHDAVVQAIGGAPVKIVSPCEGTGYEIGSMSIIKGAKNLEPTRKQVVRLGAVARGAGDRLEPQDQLPGAVEQEVPGAGAGAQAERDQADRLRLRQVRLIGRALAPVDAVGRRGLEAAEVSPRTAR